LEIPAVAARLSAMSWSIDGVVAVTVGTESVPSGELTPPVKSAG
jgi:hypothetical protein